MNENFFFLCCLATLNLLKNNCDVTLLLFVSAPFRNHGQQHRRPIRRSHHRNLLRSTRRDYWSLGKSRWGAVDLPDRLLDPARHRGFSRRLGGLQIPGAVQTVQCPEVRFNSAPHRTSFEATTFEWCQYRVFLPSELNTALRHSILFTNYNT